MSPLTRSLCTVAALGLTWATVAASFQATAAISSRLDRVSCQQEAAASLISPAHCAHR
jgi:hypothetical protein